MTKLKDLILSKNDLGDKCSIAFNEVMPQLNVLNLELHYNSFNGYNFMPFIESLNMLKLKKLDLSWNNIGTSTECVQLLADKISENKILYQLDLSHNNIKDIVVTYFNEKLAQNHSLIGLHLSGNQISLDMAGYILKEHKDKKLLQFQSEGLDLQCKIANKPDLRFICNNWITEKWQMVNIKCCGKVVNEAWKGQFKNGKLKIDLRKTTIKKMRTVTKKEVGRDLLIDKGKLTINFDKVKIEEPVFVHFEFDEFKPWYIPMNKISKEFEMNFMIPPGKWKLFFTTQLHYFITSEV